VRFCLSYQTICVNEKYLYEKEKGMAGKVMSLWPVKPDPDTDFSGWSRGMFFHGKTSVNGGPDTKRIPPVVSAKPAPGQFYSGKAVDKGPHLI
jgi:hypothetical protein